MRVVVDTNVFISSFFGGKPKEIIDLWKKGEITLCLSKPILDEYTAVLIRMGLAEEGEFSELLSLFSSGFNLFFTTKTPKINVVEEDPADDKFIECALALGADVIVTGDKALKTIEDYMGIKIKDPTAFLKEF